MWVSCWSKTFFPWTGNGGRNGATYISILASAAKAYGRGCSRNRDAYRVPLGGRGALKLFDVDPQIARTLRDRLLPLPELSDR